MSYLSVGPRSTSSSLPLPPRSSRSNGVGEEAGGIMPSPALSSIPPASTPATVRDGPQVPGHTRRFTTPSLNLSGASGPGAGAAHEMPTSRFLTPGSRFSGADGTTSACSSRAASPRSRSTVLDTWGQKDDGVKGSARLLQIHYGMSVMLRGPKGVTLTVDAVEDAGGTQFELGLEGRGLGEPHECFTFGISTKRDEKGPVHLGQVMHLRSSHAKERCLALNNEGKLGLFRTLVGASEKWTLAKPEVLKAARTGALNGAFASSETVQKSAKSPLLAGDRVVLVAHNKQALIVKETLQGYQPGVADLDSALSSHAVWEVSVAATPYYPEWVLSRPYITGQFLSRPERHKPNVTQEELFSVIPHPVNKQEHKPPPLVNFPVPVQERTLAEEVLWAVQGYEGHYIRIEAADRAGSVPASLDDVRFMLDVDSMDRSLAALATKFLPLAGAVVRVKHFVEVRQRYDYGMVSQALAAGLKVVTKDLAVLLSQLETKWLQGGLTLQRLWFHLQPALRTFEILDTLCTKAASSKGGALLNDIHAAAAAGDEKSSRTIEALLERASVPYISMLEGWIHHGQLVDPYNEFMVREDTSIAKENVESDFNAAYWDQRCTLRDKDVFRVLEDYKSEILTTGKYLNAIRECGRDVSQPDSPHHRLRYTVQGKGYFGEVIEAAYGRSCKLLLDVVLKEHHLIPRLMSIKHYFLLDKGDFFVHFMNSAEDELSKNRSDVSGTRVESLLHLSIQMSVASNDPYKDDVSSTFHDSRLIQLLTAIHQSDKRGPEVSGDGHHAHLSSGSLSALMTGEGTFKGYEALMLKYRVTWPIALIVSKKAITKYQLLFRHLFLTKTVERRLHMAWADQQSTKELNVRGALGQAYSLRHRMQHFIENYIYYMMFEVIEPHWHTLLDNLRTGVQNVDDVIRVHQEFQDTCLKECLLTNQPLLKILNKIMLSCQAFSSYMTELSKLSQLPTNGSRHVSSVGRDDVDRSVAVQGKVLRRSTPLLKPTEARRIRIREQSRVVQEQAKNEGFQKMMKTLSQNFDTQLNAFMCRLMDDSRAQHHSHLSNLCTRLNFNSYWTCGAQRDIYSLDGL